MQTPLQRYVLANFDYRIQGNAPIVAYDRPLVHNSDNQMANRQPQTRTNQPTKQRLTDRGLQMFGGVAGDHAAGVFNPATPSGSAVLKWVSRRVEGQGLAPHPMGSAHAAGRFGATRVAGPPRAERHTETNGF